MQVQRNGRKTYVTLGFAAAVEDRFLTPDGPLCLAATAVARWPAARARWGPGRASARPLRAREVWRSIVVGETEEWRGTAGLQQTTRKERKKAGA